MLVIIQARTNSKRFKNKVLKKIYDVPIIGHVVNRVKKSKYVKNVVVATSKKKFDNKLALYLKNKKINYFRGELFNVAKRLTDAANKNKANFFIRISGDSPLIDFRIINKAITIFKSLKKKPDIVTNLFPRSYPMGQSVELIRTSVLKNNYKFFSKSEKEHVTTFFYNNSKKFIIKNFKLNQKKIFIKLAIDEKKDLSKLLKKYDKKKFEKFKIVK